MRTSLPLIALCLLGCASTPSRAPSPPPARDALQLPRELGAPGATILIGDLHGTRELPAFVAQLVAQLAADRPVVLALEIAPRELPSLATYLASDGGPAARDAALRDAWWRGSFQDGRRSAAMFELLEAMRKARAGGARIEVTSFDADPDTVQSGEEREQAMASNLLALRRARPEATLVAYAGNLHTRKARGPRAPYDWMAMRLVAAGVALVSLDPRYAEGSAWNCRGPAPVDCGPHYAAASSDERGIHLERSEDGSFDGWFGLGPITASPPAAFPELAVDLDARLAGLRDSPGARRSRARRAYAAKQYAQCLAEIEPITPANADDAYTQACCYALQGDKEAAFDRLRVAIERGFQDFAHAEKDEDLVSLHGDPRWPPWPAR